MTGNLILHSTNSLTLTIMFELYQSEKSGEFYFRLKAKNGQIILSSEGYSSKSACSNGIESVKKNAADDARYERKESEGGSWSFSLKAANHQVIGRSQSYSSKDGMENGIESVMKNAPDAEVKDLTAA
jgi:hypothetical protein